MDILLQLINSGACALIMVALSWAVLSSRVNDGVIVKAGLICMALGFGSTALLMFDGVRPSQVVGLERALILINAGLTVVIFGYLWRKTRLNHPVRRTTDWSALMDTRPADWSEP